MGIICYRPNKGRLLSVVDSVLRQKHVRLQLIVADDGSEEDHFDAVEALLKERNFTNYTLVKNPVNQGTVKNCLSAVRAAAEPYVKLLSPEDFFSTDTALYQWVSFLEEQGAAWSICDIYCYRREGEHGLTLLECDAHPQMMRAYIKQNQKAYRWHYLAYGDLCWGAAILHRTDIFCRYLQELAGKVTYAEDNTLSLMMMDGLSVAYLPRPLVMYEYGSGISTSGSSKWSERIGKDRDQTLRLMLERCDTSDRYGRWLYRALRVRLMKNRPLAKVCRLLLPGYFLYRLRHKLGFRRKTPATWMETPAENAWKGKRNVDHGESKKIQAVY